MACTVPERYESMTLTSWQPAEGERDPRPDLQRWVTDPKRPWSVTLLGPTGTGKTHLGSAVFKLWVSPGHERYGWWLDATDAIQLLRSEAAGQFPERQTPVSRKLADPRLLMLDDLGCTRMTDFVHEQFMYALSKRYNSYFPTIITTNAEALEALDAIDPRLTSRLHEGLVVKLSGRDRRVA